MKKLQKNCLLFADGHTVSCCGRSSHLEAIRTHLFLWRNCLNCSGMAIAWKNHNMPRLKCTTYYTLIVLSNLILRYINIRLFVKEAEYKKSTTWNETKQKINKKNWKWIENSFVFRLCMQISSSVREDSVVVSACCDGLDLWNSEQIRFESGVKCWWMMSRENETDEFSHKCVLLLLLLQI